MARHVPPRKLGSLGAVRARIDRIDRALARRYGAPEAAVARVYRAMIAAGVALERRLIAVRNNS